MRRTIPAAAAALLALCVADPAGAQVLVPSGQCLLVVASRPDIAAARQYILETGRQGNARTFQSGNGWFAIVSETIPNAAASRTIARMKASGLVPTDAFCSLGGTYVREVEWRSDDRPPDPATGVGLWAEFDSRPLDRTEKRLLQAGLAMEGYYAGLLDGAWGRGSQGALDRYVAERFDGARPANAHACLLAVVTLDRLVEVGWTYEHVDHLDISAALPTGRLRLLERDGPFEAWRHVSKGLVVTFDDLDADRLARSHREHAEHADAVRAPYVLRGATTWFTSLATPTETIYVRSDLIAGMWSTIYVVGDRSLRTEVGLIASSIRPGPPAAILPSENGLLIAYANEIAALVHADGEPPSPRRNAGTTGVPPQGTGRGPSGRSTGTAFFVTDRGVALTNAHVVAGCASIVLGGLPAEVVSISAAFDLAAIRLTIPEETAPLPFARRDAGLNADITIAGYPLHGLLGGLNVGRGSVSSLKGLGGDETSLQISAPVQPGNSGGPAIDRLGNVVGVVVSKLDAVALADATGDIAQNINFAIRGSLARAFLASNGIVHAEIDGGGTIAPEAAAALLEASTRLVECDGSGGGTGDRLR